MAKKPETLPDTTGDVPATDAAPATPAAQPARNITLLEAYAECNGRAFSADDWAGKDELDITSDLASIKVPAYLVNSSKRLGKGDKSRVTDEIIHAGALNRMYSEYLQKKRPLPMRADGKTSHTAMSATQEIARLLVQRGRSHLSKLIRLAPVIERCARVGCTQMSSAGSIQTLFTMIARSGNDEDGKLIMSDAEFAVMANDACTMAYKPFERKYAKPNASRGQRKGPAADPADDSNADDATRVIRKGGTTLLHVLEFIAQCTQEEATKIHTVSGSRVASFTSQARKSA